MAHADPDSYLEEQTRAALAEAIEALNRANVSGATKFFARALLRRLKGLSEYEAAIVGVDLLSNEVGEVDAILSACAAALAEAEHAQGERLDASSDIWWNTRTRSLLRDLRADRTAEGLSLWVRTWVDGLAAEEWARCQELVTLQGLPPDASQVAHRMQSVTASLQSGDYATALQPLEELLHLAAVLNTFTLAPDEAVRLAVLRTRILGKEFSDVESRRAAAADALDLAGDDARRRALALAALAETQLDSDDVESARDSLKQIHSAWLNVDALLVSGLLCERDSRWAEADVAYDRALETGPSATRPELLRRVPSRLLLRAARPEGLAPLAAVDLLERAIANGVPGESDYPEQEAYQALAMRLRDLAREEERAGGPAAGERSRARAADALMNAGRRYSAAGLEPRALELYEQACSLAPGAADYFWTLAESRRVQAYQPDGTLNQEFTAMAWQDMSAGLRIRLPRVGEAWAFITAALIEDNLPDAECDPVLLAERALLLDPDYDLGYAFLALILRGKGWLQEAYEVTSKRLGPYGIDDAFLFGIHLSLLLDRGEGLDALKLLDLRRQWGDDDELRSQTASVLLSLGKERAHEAMEILAGAHPTDYVRILRADAAYASGDRARAQEEFASVWADARSSPASQVAGWTAFRSAHLDDGIRRYRDLAERGDARTAFARDLGQMLLVRGDAGDLMEARGLLQRGIEACPFAEELVRLEAVELRYVSHAVESMPHKGLVADEVLVLGKHIHRRVNELRGARRPSDDLGARLAEGRRLLLEGEPLGAVAVYADLARDARVPEVEHALMRATLAARDEADWVFIEGQKDKARQQWLTAEAALGRLTTDDANDLLVSLTCRRRVAELMNGHTEPVARWLDTVDVNDVLPELLGAAHVLAYDPSSLWRLHEGLQEVSQHSRSNGSGVLKDALLDPRQLERAYGLAAEEVGTRRATFLSVNPLELRLGTGSEDLVETEELAEAIANLQSRIEGETGVRIPWLHAVRAPQLPASRGEVRLYGRRVGEFTLDGDRSERLRQLMPSAEAILRSHLYRLVSVDDVALWLEGWDLTHVDAPSWKPADRLDSQLRLARVLRMLIREGVSVRDRKAIVGVLNAPDDVDRRRASATLDALREVRRALGPLALGAATNTVVAVPQELERRLAEGIDRKRPVWVRSREDTQALVTDLRKWLKGQPERPVVVSVEDPLLRPFAWRLLGAEQPPVRVVSSEELA